MKLIDKNHCTGCGACVNACPFDAIAMVSDVEGFLHPRVDSVRCVDCGKCTRACPLLSQSVAPEQVGKNPLCGCSGDIDVWRTSASGGAFTEVCNALSGANPIVFGAKFEDVSCVVHKCVEGVDSIGLLRKSKYVQSDIGFSLRECKRYLEAGRQVIFSGTPCQIAGLSGFLGKEYPNLLTVEFICHGVGSPKVFGSCLKNLEKKYGKEIVSYTFRHKTDDPKLLNHYVSRIKFADDSICVVVDDLYNRLFLSQAILRSSCVGKCRFRDEKRFADITLCDCRGERRLYPDKDEKNWSVVVANTTKGFMIVEMLRKRMDLKPYSYELLKSRNPLYWRDVSTNPPRSEFFSRYVAGQDVEWIAKKIGVIQPNWKLLLRRIFGRIKRIAKEGLGK